MRGAIARWCASMWLVSSTSIHCVVMSVVYLCLHYPPSVRGSLRVRGSGASVCHHCSAAASAAPGADVRHQAPLVTAMSILKSTSHLQVHELLRLLPRKPSSSRNGVRMRGCTRTGARGVQNTCGRRDWPRADAVDPMLDVLCGLRTRSHSFSASGALL